nr:MAG TPA: hypothetical protein [Caudoviricetes sp.]
MLFSRQTREQRHSYTHKGRLKYTIASCDFQRTQNG